MANIEQRGKHFRARITFYKNGKRDYLTKTFQTKMKQKFGQCS
ncbi:hypothetical protein J2Z60_000389 [Lactobacillus colini]|uniref:Integrase n=1 Tax=Lactobacillus colini TaxID=1819254 RepID=A0ABS4MC11_9LACO|nr:hypothetical protein [Lactobacillus colini]